MPDIRMRFRNGGPLDFVVVEEEDVAGWEMVGWEIDEDQPPQPREEEERINMPEDMPDIPVGGEEAREGRLGGRPLAEELREANEGLARALNEHRAQMNERFVRVMPDVVADAWLRGAQWEAADQQAIRVRGGGIGDVPPPMQVNFKRPVMEKLLRGEELFKLILTGIKEVYDVDAVIAGGAVRDVAAGTTDHKDVDVFIPMKWEDFQKDVGQLGWTGVPYKVNKKPYDGKLKKLPATVRASAHVQGLTLDLIFMERDLTPEYVATFPVLTQRGVYTLNEGLRLSPEAKADIDGKKFTIDPEIKDKDQIKIIRDKVNEWKKRGHYKDWKIVEPDIKEWWEKKEDKNEIPFEDKTEDTIYAYRWWVR